MISESSLTACKFVDFTGVLSESSFKRGIRYLFIATTLLKALEVYNNKDEWNALRKRDMLEDHSWKKSAIEYENMYKKVLG